MKITFKVAAVGGVPVTIAATIAIIAWLMLQQADKARNAAVLAGSSYRDLVAATTARNDYVHAAPAGRREHAGRFVALAEEARRELDQLAGMADSAEQQAAVAAARDALVRYAERMERFVELSVGNDALIAAMAEQAVTLTDLTDRARERQHASNTDVAASLAEADRKLGHSREIVDLTHGLRDALSQVRVGEAAFIVATRDTQAAQIQALEAGLGRLAEDARVLDRALATGGGGRREEVAGSAQAYIRAIEALKSALDTGEEAAKALDHAAETFAHAGKEMEAVVAAFSHDDGKHPAEPGAQDRLAALRLYAASVTSLGRSFALGTDSRDAAAGRRALDDLLAETARLAARADFADISAAAGRLQQAFDTLAAAGIVARQERNRTTEARAASARAAAYIDGLTHRVLKVNITEDTAIHDEVSKLLAHSVQANETEQAIQNVAITVLKLSRRMTIALARRDAQAMAALIPESDDLSRIVAMLPISPLIQDEVMEAITIWRDSLVRTAEGLARQNGMIVQMDHDASTVAEGARTLNDIFSADATRIGDFLRSVLVLGATIGLMLGGGTAFLAARSITRPVQRLQRQMLRLAEDPLAGGITDIERHDELGDMARAVHFFATELGRRERALVLAKERADGALEELRRTQANLIQAEKMASLGQLVAGVAHEINTPVGIALTGASYLADEVARLEALVNAGPMRKSELNRFLENTRQTTQLLVGNIGRAADLVQSFKLVAVDHATEDRRHFQLKAYLDEVLLSLGLNWRKEGHQLEFRCPEGIEMDGYPGVLAQIVTNLVMNSLTHAFDSDMVGHMALVVNAPDENSVEMIYTDDGKGIPPENLAKVFDPFFTTRRGAGSTGLGLNIVYNLISGKLGGQVALESAVGQGVRFTLRIPRSLPVHPVPVR